MNSHFTDSGLQQVLPRVRRKKPFQTHKQNELTYNILDVPVLLRMIDQTYFMTTRS